MKRWISLLLAGLLAVSLTACGRTPVPAAAESVEIAEKTPARIYRVCSLISGNLGDKACFDSAESGLEQLKADGRVELTTIEMGDSETEKTTWLSTLQQASASAQYDLILCGTAAMADCVRQAAQEYPAQKYLIYDDSGCAVENDNVASLTFRYNELGYLTGIFAAGMTEDIGVPRMNAKAVVGVLGAEQDASAEDALYGFALGAQSVEPEIQVDARFLGGGPGADAVSAAVSSMLENGCDLIWCLDGGIASDAAQAVLAGGDAWIIGSDADQEQNLSAVQSSAALTSGLCEIGRGLIWFFDEWDAGNVYWGQEVSLGAAEGGVRLVTDGNYQQYAADETKSAVKSAEDALASRELEVPSVIGDAAGKLEALLTQLQPVGTPASAQANANP